MPCFGENGKRDSFLFCCGGSSNKNGNNGIFILIFGQHFSLQRETSFSKNNMLNFGCSFENNLSG